MKNVDYILVGQGIAGSVLACTLLKNKSRILVIDEEKEITSSKIAYGLCNPIVFKRFVKTFLADEAFEYAHEYYTNLEKELDAHFVRKLPLFKIFNNKEQREDWISKANSPEYEKYLSKEKKIFNNDEKIINPFGAAEVLNTFLLSTNDFIKSIKLFLIDNASYRIETFNSNEIVIEPNEVHYKGIHAKKIIFCDGYKSASNKYFSWLPFNLCKGERLDVKFDSIHTTEAISNNVVLIPEKEKYILGSTYSWDELNEVPTEKGKEELKVKFNKISNVKFQISNHQAAVRPTTIDRRPFLGLHPKHQQLAIFNGMGTKSVMFAPYLSTMFCKFLMNKGPLMQSIDINRFASHFQN